MDEKKRVAGKTNLTDSWFEQLQDSEMEEGQGYEEKKKSSVLAKLKMLY